MGRLYRHFRPIRNTRIPIRTHPTRERNVSLAAAMSLRSTRAAMLDSGAECVRNILESDGDTFSTCLPRPD